MDKKIIVQTSIPEQAGQITFPFDNNQFKDFMVSLLGKPQTISKRFRGSFEIDKDSIFRIFDLIEKRVHQQNDAKLIQFRATIYYNDNSTITLTGYNHLIDYNEPEPITPKALHLTWQYIIRFQDKGSYEKQEISLSFLTPSGYDYAFDDISYNGYFSEINIRISHTARTWGADIEGLLSKHIKTITSETSRIRKLFTYNPMSTEKFLPGVIFLIVLTSSIVIGLNLKAMSSYQYQLYFMFFLTFAYILSCFLTFILEQIDPESHPSFILLTQQSFKDKEKDLKKYEKSWRNYFLTLFLGVLGSLIASCVFYVLVKT